jgi:hypothetical protein
VGLRLFSSYRALDMPTALPCTCCAREGTLRCSGCWKVGLVVPFCSVEHQKMVSGFRSRAAGDGGIARWMLRRVSGYYMELICDLVLSA